MYQIYPNGPGVPTGTRPFLFCSFCRLLLTVSALLLGRFGLGVGLGFAGLALLALRGLLALACGLALLGLALLGAASGVLLRLFSFCTLLFSASFFALASIFLRAVFPAFAWDINF